MFPRNNFVYFAVLLDMLAALGGLVFGWFEEDTHQMQRHFFLAIVCLLFAILLVVSTSDKE